MAYSKAVMDAAAEIKAGSVVTAMTRNGREFGIRVSGTGDRWFTAPVNTPQGLFFTGYSRRMLTRISAIARLPKRWGSAARR